ncbi:MAG: hypothetical protein JXB48_22790 [Candidatus Latescibacteria bacterium]|nr:hypothetical protein [Candidatus Latescibacterota bacterium]
MKKIVYTCMIILLGLLFCIGSAWSSDSWYVDPVNGDDTIPAVMAKNNSAYPFQHIWKALTEASTGDSLLLKSGDYVNEGIKRPESGTYGYTYIYFLINLLK